MQGQTPTLVCYRDCTLFVWPVRARGSAVSAHPLSLSAGLTMQCPAHLAKTGGGLPCNIQWPTSPPTPKTNPYPLSRPVLALQEAGAELACAVPAWNESGDPCSAATCGAAGSPACAWPGVACEAWAVVGLALPSAGCTGTLSPALGQLPGLRRLDLSSNALWGGVPDALGALGALRYLDLGGNALTGTLPAALGRTALQTLLAGGNALTGRLPPFWAYAGNLARVALAGNALTGTLPADWGRLAALRSLDLGGNALTGTLPPAWLALPRLTLLGLFNNCGICGDLPAHAAPASLHLEAAGTALGQPCSPANCHGGDGAGVHSGASLILGDRAWIFNHARCRSRRLAGTCIAAVNS